MVLQFTSFLEKAESVSPSSAGFALTAGKASMSLYLDHPAPNDLQSAASTILGNVQTATSDGRLQRTLPMGHPLYTWMYASNISDIRGIGQPVQATNLQQLEAPPLRNWLLYPFYEFRVDFTPRPYVLLQDSSIPLQQNNTFYDDLNQEAHSVYAPEYLRFTDWQPNPRFNSITADFGYMKFRTQSAAAPGNGVQFLGKPRVFLPDYDLRIWWYNVPYRFVNSKNSFIDYFIGRVNQNDFTTWKAGSLLYVGYNPRRYTPPVPELDPFYTGTQGFIQSAEKWCDLEFMFMRTTRKGTDVPQGTQVQNRPELQDGNRNWVAAGHNLMPWIFDRKFHYASVDPTSVGQTDLASKQTPSYFSFPFELLFTDPDAPGVYQVPQ